MAGCGPARRATIDVLTIVRIDGVPVNIIGLIGHRPRSSGAGRDASAAATTRETDNEKRKADLLMAEMRLTDAFHRG